MIELIKIGDFSLSLHWALLAMTLITWLMALVMWYWREHYTPATISFAEGIKRVANLLKGDNDKQPTQKNT